MQGCSSAGSALPREVWKPHCPGALTALQLQHGHPSTAVAKPGSTMDQIRFKDEPGHLELSKPQDPEVNPAQCHPRPGCRTKQIPVQRMMEMNSSGTLGCVGERWEGQGGHPGTGWRCHQPTPQHLEGEGWARLLWWHLRGQGQLQQRRRLGPAACSG